MFGENFDCTFQHRAVSRIDKIEATPKICIKMLRCRWDAKHAAVERNKVFVGGILHFESAFMYDCCECE